MRTSTSSRWFVLAAAGALVLSGCGYGPGSVGAEIDPASTEVVFDPNAGLIVATTAVPTGFDPHRERTAGERPYYFPVFDRLTRLDENLQPTPMLAESWELAPDAMSLTMKLRTDVSFHDGDALDAETVRLNIERAKSLEDSTVKPFLSTVTSVEEIDQHTVEFRFNAPSPDFAVSLAGPVGAVMSRTGISDPAVDLRKSPGLHGSGPYVVEKFTPSQSVTYVRAPGTNWDADAGRLARLEIRYVADDRTRDSAIRAGEIDVALVNGAVSQAIKQAELAAQGSTLRLVERETNVLAALWLRSDRLTDPRVRQALVSGIDRGAIADGYFQGMCASSAQLSRAGFAGHLQDFEDPYPFDPERSKELLAEAGYVDGMDFDLSYIAGREALPVISSDDLARSGVRSRLQPGTSIEALTAYRTSQTDSFMFQVAPMGTVAETVKWIQSKAGLEFTDPLIADLAAKASRAVSPEERESSNADLVRALADSAAFVPICHFNSYYLVASDVIGFSSATSPEAQYMLDLRSVGRAK
ncbi:hypothetical protein A0W34_30130 (plasmid) [Rhodococcus sp. BH4]|uniref:ABC transporter substrate-binding protein n=1 Tax=Rhodococcus sp. BH4 TaxID=1807790 RepID=UPI0009C29FF7|nr:ABC transporter substrate-binding protein [Rhodococcus sp. BH4]ARE37783.1 hypothetical protein A0W34_30130 [Rhodococcus sp. BH4]